MSERERLIIDIERFLRKTGMGPTQFSVESCGQRGLMTRLRRGEGVTLETVDKVRTFMRTYKAKKKHDSAHVERVSA